MKLAWFGAVSYTHLYMSVLILNREQVKQVISMKEVIQEVREVYRLKSQRCV